MRRALLIGSQTYGLTGVHPDVEVLADALTAHGITVTTAIEGAASTDGIRERYRGLIEDTGPDDAAFVYYSGHGGRVRMSGLGWVQYIVPTDAHRDDGEGFVLADELSAWQWEITQRTREVTVVLDCCHAARMSRDATGGPAGDRARAIEENAAPPEALAARRRAVLADTLPPTGEDANRHAVRLVACSPEQSAFEGHDPKLGGRHGALTAALVTMLRTVDVTSTTWRDALAVMRPRVRARFAAQRPEVEGPDERLVLGIGGRSAVGVLPVAVRDGQVVLEHAALFGVAPDDLYALVPPGGDPATPTNRIRVTRVQDDVAELEVVEGHSSIRPGSSAWPVAVALGRRPVMIGHGAGREPLLERIARTPTIRPSDDPEACVAAVRFTQGIELVDAGLEPLLHAPRALTDDNVDATVGDLERLARADHVRDLPSSPGAQALATVHVDVRRLVARGDVAVPDGGSLYPGDRLVVLLHNAGGETRYVGVFDVGIAGAVTLLSISEPDGLTLAPNDTYELGRDWSPDGGIEVVWPGTVPRSGRRLQTVLVVVADAPIDGLRRLGQPGVSRMAGADSSLLARLIDDVAVGRRDLRVPVAGPRHLVHRFDVLLHPCARPANAD